MASFPHQRIAIIGTTAAGKSTLAEALSEKFNLPYVELDALYWGPNWTPVPFEEFWDQVETAIEGDRWVVVGNYQSVRWLIWDKADAIIWLDYPFRILFWRLLKRTVQRSLSRELLWGKNRDTFGRHLKFWSQDSLFFWLFKTYWQRKRETPFFLSLPSFNEMKIFHFKHPKQTEAWLNSLVIDA